MIKEDDPEEVFLEQVPYWMTGVVGRMLPRPSSWGEWASLFSRTDGLFDRPVILLIDEFDKLPPAIIGRLIQLFRSIYLDRSKSLSASRISERGPKSEI